jgi:MFS superfamily sulfate permease-like transporter
MSIAARLVSYFVAGVTSSAVFVVWTACSDFSGPMGKQSDLVDVTSEALRGWPYIFALALLLMFLPWCLMIGISRWLPFRGPVYCASGTALAALLAFGCVGGFLAAHGHPTFPEGFALAIETSGLPILVSGAAGGLIYWLVRERDERIKKMQSVD